VEIDHRHNVSRANHSQVNDIKEDKTLDSQRRILTHDRFPQISLARLQNLLLILICTSLGDVRRLRSLSCSVTVKVKVKVNVDLYSALS